MTAFLTWLFLSLVIATLFAIAVWLTRQLMRANARDIDSYGVEIDR